MPKIELESNQDARARTVLERTIKQHPDGKYEVGLLWASNDVQLLNSFNMALNQLKCFERRLKREPSLRSSA